ncbi:MAG: TetR/AcrR family transcriptional regulator [Sedimentisphaerales bacterium]|nr:TetR/AcrR family transcriptional regulator [Sedimentisphaerales bacterium]
MADNIEIKDAVKQRLLNAGEELFSEFGLDGTSTRQLTKRADCNLASVNYYFGGKYELYLEVIRRKLKYLKDLRTEMIRSVIADKGQALTIEDLLRVFAESFIEPLMEDESGRQFKKMIRWEMITPKFPVQEFIDEMIKPVMQLMFPAMRKLCPNLSDDKIVLCLASVVGQLLHIIQTGEMFSGAQAEKFVSFSIQQRIDHIVEFSSAAIKGMSS